MTNINILDEVVKQINNSINLSEYHNEHPYMIGGNVMPIKLRVNKKIFTQIVDWFGKDIKVHKDSETDSTIDVTVRASENAMHYWLLQYGENVRAVDVTDEFAKKMREAANKIYNNYNFNISK